MSGAIGCRGGSWSKELEGMELRGAFGGERDQEPRGSRFLDTVNMANPSNTIPVLQCGMLISKCSPCTAVHFQTVSLS